MSDASVPEMASSSSKLPRLTLIVAVTPSYGIGRNGMLPWPRIKDEMAYFARITQRVPPPPPPSTTGEVAGKSKNAVLMGRKTWESIPARFRPLPNRINVVVSRQQDLDLGGVPEDQAFTATGITEGLKALTARYGETLGRVFVIGGAQIYSEALNRPETDRVLLSRIKEDYECDTFFPVKFGDSSHEGAKKWELASGTARDQFLGEEGVGGDKWSVELWEQK